MKIDSQPKFVKLSSERNYDYERRRDIGYPAPRKTVKIKSFQEASQVCRDYIEERGMGGGNWSGGQILNEDKEQIAYVSYNGRVWDMEGNEIPL